MSQLSGNEHLVERLRGQARVLESDAAVMSRLGSGSEDKASSFIWSDSGRRMGLLASDLDAAADAIVALTAALEGLVEGVEDADNPSDQGLPSHSDQMQTARALLARVRAGTEVG